MTATMQTTPTRLLSRPDLKSLRAEALEAQSKIQTMMRETNEADAAINVAVDEHSHVTAKLRAELAATSSPVERDRLNRDIDEANRLLDATCKTLRGRIERLQRDSLHLITAAPHPNDAESFLIRTASAELQDEFWHCDQDFQHADARRAAARKALATAEGQLAAAESRKEPDAIASLQTEVRRWQAECEHLGGLVEKLRSDKEEIRQRMLTE